MSTEIEAWARIDNGKIMSLCCCEEDAKELSKMRGGTVVRLSGKMPRQLRKVSTEVWIEPRDVKPNGVTLGEILGFCGWNSFKSNDCKIMARITLEELEGK